MRLGLIEGSYQGVSVSLDSQKTTNLMFESAESKYAKSPAALVATPGLKFLADADGTNKQLLSSVLGRGLYEMPPLAASTLGLSSLLAITATQVYMIVVDENAILNNGKMNYFAPSALKTLPNKRTLARFAESPTKVVFTTGGNSTDGYAYAMDTASWSISSALVFDGDSTDFVPLCDVIYLAGYFVGWCNVATASSPRPGRQLFYSQDGTSWSALDYIEPSATADTIKRSIVKNDHIWVFKGKHVPIFAPTGDANNPFAPIETATINHGCINGATVAQEGDFIYWVGGDINGDGLVVYKAVGATAERVSNGFVEKLLQKAVEDFGITALDDMSATSCVRRGHPLYLLSIPAMKTTAVFDELTNRWFEERFRNPDTGEDEAAIGWVRANFNHKSVVFDRRTGLASNYAAIYEESEAFKDYQIQPLASSPSHTLGTDTIIRRERVGATISDPEGRRLEIGEIELYFERGEADATGQGSDPSVTLEISRDGGFTYGNARTKSIGKVGERKHRCRFQRNGSAYQFTPRISMTDPNGWKLVDARADVEALA